MSANTGIEWTDATWNPIRGCTRVSAGCQNCYAESVAARFSGPGLPYEGLARRRSNGEPQWTGKILVVEKHMLDPLRWESPRRIFVNSMSDLFHPGVSDDTIDRVFAVMALAKQHTFQILTKRPERMLAYFTADIDQRGSAIGSALGNMLDGDWIWKQGKRFRRDIEHLISLSHGMDDDDVGFAQEEFLPLRNVQLGVSCESQEAADERVWHLLNTPAAVRFVSAEPLLDAIDFTDIRRQLHPNSFETFNALQEKDSLNRGEPRNRIDWIIAGGESGPGARACDVQWIEYLVRQCRDNDVACFVKQLGGQPYDSGKQSCTVDECCVHDYTRLKLNDRKGGDINEWPESLRVREFPT